VGQSAVASGMCNGIKTEFLNLEKAQ